MSTPQRHATNTHRRCWLCTRMRPILGGQVVPTRVPHWVCKRCWKTKYLQIADSALALLPPAAKFALLVERARDPRQEPFAKA